MQMGRERSGENNSEVTVLRDPQGPGDGGSFPLPQSGSDTVTSDGSAHGQSARVVQEQTSASHWQPLAPLTQSKLKRVWVWALGAMVLLLIVLSAYLLSRYRLAPCMGVVTGIERGGIGVQDDVGAPRDVAREGRLIRQGALLRSSPGTVVILYLCGETRVRIESQGEWRVEELLRSPNGRLSRITIRQKLGRTSFISPAPRRGTNAQVRIELPGARADLLGVGVFTTFDDGLTRVDVLQGECTLSARTERVVLTGGESVIVDPLRQALVVDKRSAP